MSQSRPFSFCLRHFYFFGLFGLLLFGLPLLIILVDFHHDCEEDKQHACPLQVVDLMSEVEDIDDDCEALAGGDDEGRDMLFEHLDHPIDYQLSQCVQDGEIEEIGL